MPPKIPHDPVRSAAWIKAVVNRRARCVVCLGKDRLQGHHILAQADLRNFCRSLRLPVDETNRILWDERNALALCKRHHDQFENSVITVC
jgi:hypothetical protein